MMFQHGFHRYFIATMAQVLPNSVAAACCVVPKPPKRRPSRWRGDPQRRRYLHRHFAHLGGLGVILNKMVMVLQRRLAKTYTSKNMVTSVEVTLWSSGLQLTVKLFEHLKKFKIFEFVFVILASPGRKPSRHAAFSCPWIQSLGVDGEEIWGRKWSKKHADIDSLTHTWSNKKVTQVLLCCIFGFFVFACVQSGSSFVMSSFLWFVCLVIPLVLVVRWIRLEGGCCCWWQWCLVRVLDQKGSLTSSGKVWNFTREKIYMIYCPFFQWCTSNIFSSQPGFTWSKSQPTTKRIVENSLQDEFGIDEEQRLGYSRKEFQCSQSGSKYRMTQGIWTWKHPAHCESEQKKQRCSRKDDLHSFLLDFFCLCHFC